MKKLFIILLFTTVYSVTSAQETDSIKVKKITLDDIYNIVNMGNITPENYKLYETSNMWTFLKLDTRNGKIWQVQYSTQGEEYRFQSVLNEAALTYEENTYPNRFELYKTQNIYNFILLDKKDGRAWQVQWGKEDERAILRIY